VIRYPILDEAADFETEDAELRRLIEAQHRGWLEAETKQWRDIKRVYMKLQHGKCAYCERRLGTSEKRKIEHDVEHFRPKNRVLAWPTEADKEKRGLDYELETGDGFEAGYPSLRFSPWNSLVACKTCNTMDKHDYSPIAGNRCEANRTQRILVILHQSGLSSSTRSGRSTPAPLP